MILSWILGARWILGRKVESRANLSDKQSKRQEHEKTFIIGIYWR